MLPGLSMYAHSRWFPTLALTQTGTRLAYTDMLHAPLSKYSALSSLLQLKLHWSCTECNEAAELHLVGCWQLPWINRE